MLIVVEGKEVETKDIVRIVDAGWRMLGFVIQLTGDREVRFLEHEKYDSYPSEVAAISHRYRELRRKVEEYWEKDKNDIPCLSL